MVYTLYDIILSEPSIPFLSRSRVIDLVFSIFFFYFYFLFNLFLYFLFLKPRVRVRVTIGHTVTSVTFNSVIVRSYEI